MLVNNKLVSMSQSQDTMTAPSSFLPVTLLQTSICTELIKRLLSFTPCLSAAANAVAELDCLCSFAAVARELGYCRPTLTTDNVIVIEGGEGLVLAPSHMRPPDSSVIILPCFLCLFSRYQSHCQSVVQLVCSVTDTGWQLLRLVDTSYPVVINHSRLSQTLAIQADTITCIKLLLMAMAWVSQLAQYSTVSGLSCGVRRHVL